ncbi:MAG: hypothetical protein RLZZ214_2981 [Verrucomicrobiota bacterium]|jgi:hypothetical protein
MKTSSIIAIAFAIAGFTASARAGTTYQATGPVLEATPTKIVIQKDQEKWEIARTADTKITGEVKVGAKVTVHYTMTATNIEVKPEKPAAAPAKKTN